MTMKHSVCTYCDHTGPDVTGYAEPLCVDEDACVGRREAIEAARRRARFKAKQAESTAQHNAKKEV